jgi:site-specific DNA recombinase
MQTAVIYTRVSTDEQKENGFSLQDQEARLRRECKRRNIDILEHYQDDASAKTFKRRAFQRFLDDLKSRKFRPDIFFCTRMDRFSRNTMESLNMIAKFKTLNIKLECLENNIDLNTPESLLPFMMNVVMPEVENKRRGLNTKRGMRQALKEGRWASTAPYGYKNNKVTKLVEVDAQKAALVQHAFDTFSKGCYSAEEVRRMCRDKGLNLSKQAFLNMLSNPFYIGRISIPAFDDEPSEVVNGVHETIITDDKFHQVQHILTGKKRPYKGITSSDQLLLMGILKCPNCGRQLTGSASKGNGGVYHYYRCQRKYGCKTNIRAQEANDKLVEYLDSFEVSEEIVGLYTHVLRDVFHSNESEKEAQKKSIECEIEKVKKQAESLDEKFLDDLIPSADYNRLKSTLEAKSNELTMRHVAINKMVREFDRYIKYATTLVSNVGGYYVSATSEIKRKMIGLIFPESLIYADGAYRTTKMNQVFEVICSASKGFKKKQPHNNVKLSTMAPPAGLEPATL